MSETLLLLFGWPLVATIIGVAILKVINRIFQTNFKYLDAGESVSAKIIDFIMFLVTMALAFPVIYWIRHFL